MQWFRFYGNTVFSPKVQMLSAEMFKAWVNLLCIYSVDAEFPSVPHIAFTLHLTEEQVIQALEHLSSVDLLDKQPDGSYVPHNWSERQFATDNSTERVKKHRDETAKKQSTKRDVTVSETKMKRCETVSETPSESDTDTYTETHPKEKFDFDAEALLSEITKRHPKQEGAAQGKLLLAQVIMESVNPEQAAVSINERHRKFCEIECAGRERKFVPSLLNWVRDKKYLDPDPIPEGVAAEPAKKPIPVDPDEFREMALKLRATNERRMAEEQARIAKEQREWDAQYGQTG